MGGLTDTDDLVLEELDQDWEIVCDYADPDRPGDYRCPGPNPAQWIGRARCPECHKAASRLLCTPCKDLVLSTEHGCRCANCECVVIPFRRVFTSFDPLRQA